MTEIQRIIEGMSGSELYLLRARGVKLPAHLQSRLNQWKSEQRAKIQTKADLVRLEHVADREQAIRQLVAMRERERSAA